MATAVSRDTEHEITLEVAAKDIYDLLIDVNAWPRTFPPTIHAEQLAADERSERIQIWATANEDVKTWTSWRTFDPEGLRIDFRQEVPAPPVAGMGGTWIIEPVSPTRSRLRLLHDFRAVDDDPGALAWIEQAVDRNSTAELAALKVNLEAAVSSGEQSFAFEDTVRIAGSAQDVYDFLNGADRWPERLPHVARVDLQEKSPGLQVLQMDTRAQDGSQHTTRSVRVCFPARRIVYKQTTLPALMTLHTGYWDLVPDADGVLATSQHRVVVNKGNIATVLGPDADLAQAQEYVRSALSTNSLATLRHARAFAESR
jgi:aromatase